MFLAECHLLHMIMLLLHSLKKSPFVCITQSSNNTKFCTSESFQSIPTMPARQLGDQFQSDPQTQQCCHGRRRSESQKKPIQQTNRLHIKHLYFRRRTENHDLELFLDPSHLPDLSFRQNTAICRSCVQIQSHELRLSLHFPRLHDKALSP